MMLNHIPNIMSYLVPGYIFVSVYGFISYKQDELQHTLLKSVALSFILKTVYDLINDVLSAIIGGKLYNDYVYYSGLFIFSVIAGYLVAQFFKGTFFNRQIRQALNISRATYPRMWDDADIFQPYCELTIRFKDGVKYCGTLFTTDDFGNEPQITLVFYKKYVNDVLVEDYSEDNSKLVLINTAGMEYIEISNPPEK